MPRLIIKFFPNLAQTCQTPNSEATTAKILIELIFLYNVEK